MIPYSGKAAAWLADGPVEHVAYAEVLGPLGRVKLPIGRGTMTVHGNKIPRRTANLVIPATDEVLEQLAHLDPRSRRLVFLNAGYVYPDGEVDVKQLGVMFADARGWQLEDGELSINLTSEEGPVSGAVVWTDAIGTAMPRTWGSDAIEYALAQAMPPGRTYDFVVEATGGTAVSGLDDYAVEAGMDWLSVIESVMQGCEKTVVVDRLGRWVLRDHVVTPTPAGATVLSTGPRGTITSLQWMSALEEWANAVVITAEWTNHLNERIRRQARARVKTGDYGTDLVGHRVKTYDVGHRVHIDHLRARAWSLLSRQFRLGAGWNVEGVAMYWLEPDDTVHIFDPKHQADTFGVVRNVTFDFHSGTMSLSTRETENPTIVVE